jgi:uncharacterized membrane protein
MHVDKVKSRINFRPKSLEEMEKWLSAKSIWKERGDIVLSFSITLYSILFSCITILRYYAFKTHAWDLGIFTQSLWTTLYANRFLYHTCELFINPSGSFFGTHFSPILLFILPLYRLVSTPETLLVLQSIILGLAAVPIYRLGKEYAGGRIVGLVFAIVYLMYPSTQFVNWYDFHVQAFLPLFFALTVYYVAKENWHMYFLLVFLSLMVEDHVAWIMFAMGLYVAWRYRSSIFGVLERRKPAEKKFLAISLITMALSALWYWVTIWQRNTFFPTNPAALEESLGAPNFTILGATDPLQIPLLVITRPWNAIQALAFDGPFKLLYLVLLFGPLAFFSFKTPSALIPALPWFGFSLLSQTLAHHVLGTQYDAYVISFIFAAAIFGLRKNLIKTGTLSSITGSLKKIIVFSLMFFVIASPLGPVVNTFFPSYTSIGAGQHELELNKVLSMVPANASILTQDNIFPQVSQRVDAYVVPDRFLGSGINDLAISFVNETMDKVLYILVDSKTDTLATGLVILLLETKPQFHLIETGDNGTILLYWRKP